MNGIGTRRGNAHSSLAHAALTITGRGASVVVDAFVAIGTAAIVARFFAILERVGTARSRTRARGADAARAVPGIHARLPVRTRQAVTCTAIDVTFTGIFLAIGAFDADAHVHCAHECARTALNTAQARDARAVAVANALTNTGLRAERALFDGNVGHDAVRADVFCAFFGIVVDVFVVGHLADVEIDIALPFEAIAVELSRQCSARGLQALASTFAIVAVGLAAEVGGTIVWAISGRRAFRRQAAARTTRAARTARRSTRSARATRAAARSSGTGIATAAR